MAVVTSRSCSFCTWQDDLLVLNFLVDVAHIDSCNLRVSLTEGGSSRMKRLVKRASVASLALAITLAVVGMFVGLTKHSTASAAPSGEQLFKNNCASCHADGGNIVDPKKPLKGSKKLATKATFKDLLSKPAGVMPAFPQIVNDDPSLSALYSYCKSLK